MRLHQNKIYSMLAFLFSYILLFVNCTNKADTDRNSSCDMNDNVCCTCTATYNQVGQVAATKTVCTPAEKQAFYTTWTNSLITIECKR